MNKYRHLDFTVAALMVAIGSVLGAPLMEPIPNEVFVRALDVNGGENVSRQTIGDTRYATWNGLTAELTIDTAVQRILVETLPRYADTNDTGCGWAVVLSIKDGAVLALADCGSNTNAPRPFAVTRRFMPGYLLSPITVAAAFDAGIATPETEVFKDAMEAYFFQYKRSNDGGYIWEGSQSVSNALVYSSSPVLSKLELLVGRDKEFDVMDKFGLGIRSGIGLATERAGRWLLSDKLCMSLWSNIPVYQRIELKTIPIARAYATLANHGLRVDPYVIKRIANAAGETLYEHIASTNNVQVVSRKTAGSICAILEAAIKADDLKGLAGLNDEYPADVVKSLVPPRAAGRRAAVKGVRVAGKTSTMQRTKVNSHELETDKYTAAFAGFYPLEEPKYVIVVCYETKYVEDSPVQHQGGIRPASAFAEIVRRMLLRNKR